MGANQQMLWASKAAVFTGSLDSYTTGLWSCAVYDADKSTDANAINTALA